MNGLEALQSVRYVNVNGERLAVINANDWETLIEWLETVEDLQIAKEAFSELKSFHGDREKAGWLKWNDVKEDLK